MSQAQLFGLADAKLMNLVVAGSILSIALNPIGFGLAPKIAYLLTSRWDWARRAAMRLARFETLPKETAPEALMGQVVVAGQGSPFFETFARALRAADVPLVAALQSETTAASLRAAGMSAVLVDLAKHESWVAAHLHTAKALLLVEPSVDAVAACHAAREVAPHIPIIVIAGDTGAFPEAGLDNLRFLSPSDAASRLLAVEISASLKADALPGTPIERSGKKRRDEAQSASPGEARSPSLNPGAAPAAQAAASAEAVQNAVAAAQAAQAIAKTLEIECKAANDAAQTAAHRAEEARHAAEASEGQPKIADKIVREAMPFNSAYDEGAPSEAASAHEATEAHESNEAPARPAKPAFYQKIAAALRIGRKPRPNAKK